MEIGSFQRVLELAYIRNIYVTQTILLHALSLHDAWRQDERPVCCRASLEGGLQKGTSQRQLQLKSKWGPVIVSCRFPYSYLMLNVLSCVIKSFLTFKR